MFNRSPYVWTYNISVGIQQLIFTILDVYWFHITKISHGITKENIMTRGRISTFINNNRKFNV